MRLVLEIETGPDCIATADALKRTLAEHGGAVLTGSGQSTAEIARAIRESGVLEIQTLLEAAEARVRELEAALREAADDLGEAHRDVAAEEALAVLERGPSSPAEPPGGEGGAP